MRRQQKPKEMVMWKPAEWSRAYKREIHANLTDNWMWSSAGKWSLLPDSRKSLYGHDAKSMKKDADDMIQKLNVILSKPTGFPPIPAPRTDCQSMTLPPDTRDHQYVMCPEQDCECLVHYSDQNRSMIDVLGLGQEPFWDDRVKDFYKWYSKSASKTDKDAWTWDGKDTHKWSTTRGASKRNQSVPANPADRTNPKEKSFP